MLAGGVQGSAGEIRVSVCMVALCKEATEPPAPHSSVVRERFAARQMRCDGGVVGNHIAGGGPARATGESAMRTQFFFERFFFERFAVRVKDKPCAVSKSRYNCPSGKTPKLYSFHFSRRRRSQVEPYFTQKGGDNIEMKAQARRRLLLTEAERVLASLQWREECSSLLTSKK